MILAGIPFAASACASLTRTALARVLGMYLTYRRWARNLLDASLDRLRDEARGSGGLERFHHLVPFLGGDARTGYRQVASELEMTESAAKGAVHRMRRRFRAVLRDEVARTVQDESQVDDELQHLFAVLGS